MKRTAMLLVGAMLGIGSIVLVAACVPNAEATTPSTSVSAEAPSSTRHAALPACPEEDSDNCYWDAATMGNGEGTSFVTLNGVTYYPEARRTVNLNGQIWPTVDGSDTILYCDQPLRVGIDVDDLGNEWAGCM